MITIILALRLLLLLPTYKINILLFTHKNIFYTMLQLVYKNDNCNYCMQTLHDRYRIGSALAAAVVVADVSVFALLLVRGPRALVPRGVFRARHGPFRDQTDH